jgi:hypothetical protein
MSRQRFVFVHLGFLGLVACSLFLNGSSHLAQPFSQTAPVKSDEYGDLPTDDEAAHLDFFAETLRKESKVHGYVVMYTQPQMKRGYYLRRLHGIGRYLTDSRGIEGSRIQIVDGGYRDRFLTQLWLIPEGSELPLLASTMQPPIGRNSSAYQFDSECLNCAPAVSLYLYGLDEGLKFYAEALRESQGSIALFIVRPDRTLRLRPALKEVRRAKALLIQKYGIKANRIAIRSGRSRNDGTAVAEMWIVPRGANHPRKRLS